MALNIPLAASAVSTAEAHRNWTNGLPVPAWVAKSCCGPADAHHLLPEQVHRVANGYVIDGYPGLITDAQVLPSEDGEFWAFYAVGPEIAGSRIVSSVFCFFAPTGS